MSDLEQSQLLYSFPFPQINNSSSLTLKFSFPQPSQLDLNLVQAESKQILQSSMMSSTTDFQFKPNRSFYLTLTQSAWKKEEFVSDEFEEQMFQVPMKKDKVVFRNACRDAEDLVLKLGIYE